MQDNKNLLYLAALTLILVWGTAYTLVGYTVDYIAPVWMVAARTLIAAILLVSYALLRGNKFPRLTDKRWIWYSYMGVIGMAAPFYFTAKGQIHVDSGLTSILVGFMPLLTIIMAHFFIKSEPLSPRKALGFVVGFFGIFILFLPDPFRWEVISNWKGQGYIILAATFYAALTIIAKRAPDTPASVGAAMMLISAAFFSMLMALGAGMPSKLPPTPAMLSLLALAIGSTGFAQIIYLRIIQVSGPSFVAKINYLVPICSLIAGIMFLDEAFHWRSVIAMAIIFTGLFIARSSSKSANL